MTKWENSFGEAWGERRGTRLGGNHIDVTGGDKVLYQGGHGRDGRHSGSLAPAEHTRKERVADELRCRQRGRGSMTATTGFEMASH